MNNRELAREYGVDESTIRYWNMRRERDSLQIWATLLAIALGCLLIGLLAL